jgi:SAM-dependent methyltransferase
MRPYNAQSSMPSTRLGESAHSAGDRTLERAARRWAGDVRPAGQLREQYEIERGLAARLRQATAEERSTLYAEVYDELFRRVPHHPQLRRRFSEERERQVDRELYFLAPLLDKEVTFLEVGAGDLALSRRVAGMVREVHAVDVAAEITGLDHAAANLHTALTDGRHLPLPDDSVVLAYSNQLMEHLHPDDAAEQVSELFRVLRPGGAYLCVTPNRLTGPWDVSRMFSSTPQGLHLREYSNRELAALLCEVGFEQVHAVVPAGRAARQMPAALFTTVEWALEALPPRVRRGCLRGPWRKAFNSVRLVARKGPPPSGAAGPGVRSECRDQPLGAGVAGEG